MKKIRRLRGVELNLQWFREHYTETDEEGCWIWQGARQQTPYGPSYGQLGYKGVPWKAHRLAWVLTHGSIPDGMLVLHRCDKPACVNPAHLWLGTGQDNMNDKVAKGRVSRLPGERHPNRKLTDEAIMEIRSRYVPDCRVNGQAALAREFGVRQSTIWAVVHRKSWEHI